MAGQYRRNGGNGGRQDGGQQQEKGSPPVFTARFFTGNSTVEAAVWEKTVGAGKDERITYAVTVGRSYKDGEGKYQQTQSFWPTDLPHLAIALNEAYLFIAQQNGRE